MRNAEPAPDRPETLQEGYRYLLRHRPEACQSTSWEAVSFVCYTPCPAVVIVATRPGERLRIARDELFDAAFQAVAVNQPPEKLALM